MWPLEWTGVREPHGEYVYDYFKHAYEEEFNDAKEPDPVSGVFWTRKTFIWLWDK